MKMEPCFDEKISKNGLIENVFHKSLREYACQRVIKQVDCIYDDIIRKV